MGGEGEGAGGRSWTDHHALLQLWNADFILNVHSSKHHLCRRFGPWTWCSLRVLLLNMALCSSLCGVFIFTHISSHIIFAYIIIYISVNLENTEKANHFHSLSAGCRSTFFSVWICLVNSLVMSQADDAAGGHATFMRRHCHRIPKFSSVSPGDPDHRCGCRFRFCFFLFRILSFGQVWAKLGGATSNLEDYRFIWVATKYVTISIAIDWSFPHNEAADWKFCCETFVWLRSRNHFYHSAPWTQTTGIRSCGKGRMKYDEMTENIEVTMWSEATGKGCIIVDIAIAYCRGH